MLLVSFFSLMVFQKGDTSNFDEVQFIKSKKGKSVNVSTPNITDLTQEQFYLFT